MGEQKFLWIGSAFMLMSIIFTIPAHADNFSFQNVKTLAKMHEYIQSHFPPGTSRGDIRRAFVDQGGARLVTHLRKDGTEKYVYDINLCRYYIWRWNISADYTPAGHLKEIYVNGRRSLDDQPKVNEVKSASGKKQRIDKMQRPRPEADKGENFIAYIRYERDGDLQTTDDQIIMTVGPSRVDPLNMGKMTTYIAVDPWRSIVDEAPADKIVPYWGDCDAADRAYTVDK